MNQSRNRN